MKGMLTIGMVQMAVAEDRGANVEKARRMVRRAASEGADVVCLPELFAVRYFPAARDSKVPPEPVPGPTTEALSAMAKESRIILVGGSVYERSGAKRYNTCPLFSEEGEMLSAYRKVHIPQDEAFYEQDYFTPGRAYSVTATSRGRFGTLVCFDQWYPEAARANRLLGAQVLFYPTAIARVKGVEESEGSWSAAWEAVQVGHAVANGMVVCAVNRVGTEGRSTFWGGSFVCDQFGKVIARAGSKEGVFLATCDLGLGEEVEAGWGFLRNRRPGTYRSLAR